MIKAAQLQSRLDKLTVQDGDTVDFRVDGETQTMHRSELLQMLKDDLEGVASWRTRILHNATASRGAGRLLALAKMIEIDDDEPEEKEV